MEGSLVYTYGAVGLSCLLPWMIFAKDEPSQETEMILEIIGRLYE